MDRMGKDLADAADAYLDFPESNRSVFCGKVIYLELFKIYTACGTNCHWLETSTAWKQKKSRHCSSFVMMDRSLEISMTHQSHIIKIFFKHFDFLVQTYLKYLVPKI